LSSRHFARWAVPGNASAALTPLTQQIVGSLTNDVQVTVYFDRDEPMFEPVSDLLREYQFLNSHVRVEVIDYVREPGAALLIKSRFGLNQLVDKDLVIFEANGRTKVVNQKELSQLDIQPLVSGQSREIKRTHFNGEMLFTSAILSLTSAKPSRAYFLQGHREHDPESEDADYGYSQLANLLETSNVEWQTLRLVGTNQIPADCNLLIVAGPTVPLQAEELDKLDQYLANGGRMLVLLTSLGLNKNAGLVYVLSKWDVQVGEDVVTDKANTSNGQDLFVLNYGMHPIVRPLIELPMHLIRPRSVKESPARDLTAGAPDVQELFFTGPAGTRHRDIRDGVIQPNPAMDVVTNVCLGVAVEKGKIRDVSADRGTTRLVVVGDSFFLNNHMIDNGGNRDFASLAINWLMDRSELLSGLGPRPIQEYKINATTKQLDVLRWVLLLGMPGSVLLIGLVVWARRRH
jgi:hypothetical protein